jgi:hypothetical protein
MTYDPFLDPFRGAPGTNPPRYPQNPPETTSGMGWLFGLLAVAIVVGAVTFLGITKTDQVTTAANPAATTTPVPDETTGRVVPAPH